MDLDAGNEWDRLIIDTMLRGALHVTFEEEHSSRCFKWRGSTPEAASKQWHPELRVALGGEQCRLGALDVDLEEVERGHAVLTHQVPDAEQEREGDKRSSGS